MSQTITATFVDGVLRPDARLDLPPRARVRVTVELLDDSAQDDEPAWQAFEQLCDEISVDSGGLRLTRDQLHERR